MILNTEYDFVLAALTVTNTTVSAGIAGIVALFANMIVLERTTGKAQYDLMVTMMAAK